MQALLWGMQQFAWLIGVFVILALVAAIAALIRGLDSQTSAEGMAIERLNKRYAAGKISIEEYEKSRHRLARAG